MGQGRACRGRRGLVRSDWFCELRWSDLAYGEGAFLGHRGHLEGEYRREASGRDDLVLLET